MQNVFGYGHVCDIETWIGGVNDSYNLNGPREGWVLYDSLISDDASMY